MPIIKPKIVDYLRAYAFHGVDAEVDSNSDQAVATCAFCGKERKMYIRVDTGQFQCKTCLAGNDHGGGNIYTFLRLLWEQSEAATKDYSELVTSRKFLGDHTLINWGVCLSTTTVDWIVPGYGADGKLNQLYRYIKDIASGRMKLLPTPELHHHLHGVNLYDERREICYLAEGPWDGMALWETLRLAKQGDDGLSLTASEELSLLHKANVLATPGCNVFSQAWCQLFAKKIVYLMFDSDHARIHKGKKIDGAGYIGMKRVAQLLARHEEPPKEIHFLKWGEDGFDPALPSGTDVRDILTTPLNGKPITLTDRIDKLQTLLGKVSPIPPDWVIGRSPNAEKNGNTELECAPCNNWKTLHTSWRAAMNWTEGLDRALSVMLACITSTRSIGDQLWVKVMGPAACLHADTPIFDPMDNTEYTVKERAKMGLSFHVYSLDREGVTIAHANRPHEMASDRMYQVKFESGRDITVTNQHRFWVGGNYKRLARLGVGDQIPYATKVELSGGLLQAVDTIVEIADAGVSMYYDLHVPITNNYYAVGYFHHNCGKSTLCEAVGVSRKHILAKSTIRGFHSGFKSDKEGMEDNSLASRLYDKTLVTKDGDTLLTSPNVSQILSEARDLYDGTGRSDYRNGVSREYQGLRMTWILCGTSSLRSLDSSELGERFLDCVIMEGIDDELEDEIMLRVANRTERGMGIAADNNVNTHYDPDLVEAMKLTGGYVEYLRANAQKLLGAVLCPDDKMRQCIHLGKFVAYARARPSTKQDENAEREFGTRLVSQLIRLAKCLAVVLNRKFIDDEVMRRVKKVALDTARGVTLELIHYLFKYGEDGILSKALASFTNQTEEKTRGLLRFLARIGIAEYNTTRITTGFGRSSWKLTTRMQKLYASVYHDELLVLKEEEANQNKEPEPEPDYSPTDEE